ncbi:hypothetical protein [Trichocoleus sp. FACHB-6]|nr:hypothetical protein [Trichocoleus sp. FACHB-6]
MPNYFKNDVILVQCLFYLAIAAFVVLPHLPYPHRRQSHLH